MAALTDSNEPVRAVIEQAAGWQAQLADEFCSQADREAFAAWLDIDPSHRIAFERMTAISGRMAGQDAVGRSALDRMLVKRRLSAGLVAVLLVGAGAALSLASKDPGLRARIADERTSVGELRAANLPTGDKLILDTASAADIAGGERTVSLWRGGVMAEVRTGLDQPFIIRTPQGTARALGTRFSVRVIDGRTVVTVIESRVRACSAQETQPCLDLSAGEVGEIDGAGVRRLANVDPDVGAAWSEGLLFADDLPLAGVIDEINRYRQRPVRYSAVDLDGLRITGTLPLTDPDRALNSMKAALPIIVEESPAGPVVRRR